MKTKLIFAIFLFITFLSQAQTIADVDGNSYNVVTIGTQTWMKENLKTTRYNDKMGIPLVSDNDAWISLTTPGFCWFDNDSFKYKNIYGALYNWYVIDTKNNGNRNVCPIGWHVPYDNEWKVLNDYLGGEDVAGGKLKESGTLHWNNPNEGATNESSFTALPGGYRVNNGWFLGRGSLSLWWSSTESSSTFAFGRGMEAGDAKLGLGNTYKYYGQYIRCIKDNSAALSESLNSDLTAFYPNPVGSKVFLKNVKSSNALIFIYDIHGNQILSKQIISNQLDVSNLKRGIYITKIIDGEDVLIDKMIKE